MVDLDEITDIGEGMSDSIVELCKDIMRQVSKIKDVIGDKI